MCVRERERERERERDMHIIDMSALFQILKNFYNLKGDKYIFKL